MIRIPNIANVTALPPRPRTFTTQLRFSPDEKGVNAFELYQDVIKVLFALACEDWNALLDTHETTGVTTGSTVLGLHAVVPSQTRNSYIIYGIVEMLEAMPQHNWQSGSIALQFKNHLIAVIVMAGVDQPPRDLGLIAADGNATWSNTSITSQSATEAVEAGEWKTIVNPFLLPGHIIHWRYDGDTIPGQELFLTLVDGLTQAAQYHLGARLTSLEAFAPSGRTLFYMASDVDTHGASPFYWLQCTATIRALAQEGMVPSKKFAEISFELHFEHVTIATGYIVKRQIDTASN